MRSKNPSLGPPLEALIDKDNLPVPETLRQIAPGDACPVSVQDRIDEQSIVTLIEMRPEQLDRGLSVMRKN